MFKLNRYATIVILLVIFSYKVSANFCSPPDTSKKHLSQNKTIIYDTIRTEKVIYVYDTLIVYDTIIEYDTNYFNKKSNFSIELHGSFSNANRTLKMESDENQIIDLKNSSEIIEPGYTIGMEINYKYKDLFFRSGLNFSEYREKANYNFLSYSIDQTTDINIIDNSYWEISIIDTFYQIIGIDTNMVTVTNSTWVEDIDSLYIINYDTTTTTNQYNGKNKYKYIEIPLILGKEIWKNDKLSLSTNIGLISGFLFKVSGKTVLPGSNNEIIDLEKSPYIKANFFLYGDLKLEYYLNNNFSVTVLSGYKYMMNSLYNKENIMSYKTNFINIRMGIIYNL